MGHNRRVLRFRAVGDVLVSDLPRVDCGAIVAY